MTMSTSTSTIDPAFWWIKYIPELPVRHSWFRRLARAYTTAGTPPPGITRKEVVCRSNGIDIRFILTCPAKREGRMPTMLWFHAGGMVYGNYRSDWQRMDEYAQNLGLCSISLDYRLAPEYPAPAAIDDGISVLELDLGQCRRRGPGFRTLDHRRCQLGCGPGCFSQSAYLRHGRTAADPPIPHVPDAR